jgi:hypothetical protein
MTHHRITPTIALTLALAAAAAPVAWGDPQPLAQAEAAIANAPTLSPASTGLCSEVCSGGGYGPINTPATVVRVLAPGSGFDWDDAGIGAGSAFALTIIGVGGVLTATNRRRRRAHHQHVSATS